MSFTRKSEVLAAEARAMLIEGVAMGMVFANGIVWLAIYATQATP